MLAGGVGAARFLRGLQPLLDPRQLTVVVNTGDDDEFHGLHVSPDVDTILYTLAGLADTRQGWGRRGDTFACLDTLASFYPETWFRLGDRDLATHVFRTDQLHRGRSLTQITARLADALGVGARVLPMTDDRVRTFIEVTGSGALPFQQYLVRDHGQGEVRAIRIRGARQAQPATGVLRALQRAAHVILPPSNPFVSIGPILALAGMREALGAARHRAVAISPLIAGAPVKGPLDRMLRGLGHEVSPVGVARLYVGLVDTFVLDERDAADAPRIAALGMRPVITDTLMTTPAKAARLARVVLESIHRN